jgi:FKBP-type peptidyl-prolyl cis-trans isomerase 2
MGDVMKKLIAILSLFLLVALIGCTQSTGSDNNMPSTIDTNKISDTNTVNKDTNVYTNIKNIGVIKEGDKVKVNYTGRFTDGNIFDTSIGKKPLEFTVGAHQMIRGFENAVIGMKVGETKTVTLQPTEAYGEIDQNKIMVFDKNSFANFQSIKTGSMVSAGNLSGKVISKTDQNAVIDFNPPMAGKILVFEITIVSIN